MDYKGCGDDEASKDNRANEGCDEQGEYAIYSVSLFQRARNAIQTF